MASPAYVETLKKLSATQSDNRAVSYRFCFAKKYMTKIVGMRICIILPPNICMNEPKKKIMAWPDSWNIRFTLESIEVYGS